MPKNKACLVAVGGLDGGTDEEEGVVGAAAGGVNQLGQVGQHHVFETLWNLECTGGKC